MQKKIDFDDRTSKIANMNLPNLFRRKQNTVPDSAARDSKPEYESEDDEFTEIPDAIRVTNVLDLHGFYPEQVPEMIFEFIKQAEELNFRSLRIIHGKGKSKLKWAVLNALKEQPRVTSFRDAPPELGGWGATMVTLESTS